MEKLDSIISPTLVGLIDAINEAGVQKEDMINVFCDTTGRYIAVFYN